MALYFLVVIGLVVGAVCLVLALASRVSAPTAAYSTAASIAEALKGVPPGLLPQNVESGNWCLLSQVEYDALMANISGQIENRKPESGSGVLVDPWNNPYLVAARRTPNGAIEFIVWSKGPDGLSMTPDDIVAPHGATRTPAKTPH